MTEHIEIGEFQLEVEQLHRRAADLTRELSNVNYALREKRRELELLAAEFDACVREQTRELKEANERLQHVDRLKLIFEAID